LVSKRKSSLQLHGLLQRGFFTLHVEFIDIFRNAKCGSSRQRESASARAVYAPVHAAAAGAGEHKLSHVLRFLGVVNWPAQGGRRRVPMPQFIL
jgi:hypothetical protein